MIITDKLNTMNEQEITRAEKIRQDFPTWTRPMSTEESALMDRYYEHQVRESMQESIIGFNHPPTE